MKRTQAEGIRQYKALAVGKIRTRIMRYDGNITFSPDCKCLLVLPYVTGKHLATVVRRYLPLSLT
jgi:hypothetical protein